VGIKGFTEDLYVAEHHPAAVSMTANSGDLYRVLE